MADGRVWFQRVDARGNAFANTSTASLPEIDEDEAVKDLLQRIKAKCPVLLGSLAPNQLQVSPSVSALRHKGQLFLSSDRLRRSDNGSQFTIQVHGVG